MQISLDQGEGVPSQTAGYPELCTCLTPKGCQSRKSSGGSPYRASLTCESVISVNVCDSDPSSKGGRHRMAGEGVVWQEVGTLVMLCTAPQELEKEKPMEILTPKSE